MKPAPSGTQRYGGRFEPQQEVGYGGMGTVFRAKDLQTGDVVALKVLHEREGPNADRFAQEASLLGELAHPAVVRYVDHGITPSGEHYLAMEWLEGETLEDRLTSGALTLIEAVALATRVLDALAVAHRRGVVHRDIKPANLFLPSGDLAQVKLLDFGIARRMFDGRRITRAGSTLGTPMYMSPEQARGEVTIDARSDLFSLGCVLFECLSGRPPFTGETALAVLAKICLDESPDIRKLAPGLPVALEGVLQRLLAKDREARPGDTGTLAAEMAGLLRRLESLGHRLDEPEAVTPVPAKLTEGEQRLFSAVMVSLPRRMRPRGDVSRTTVEGPVKADAPATPPAAPDEGDEALMARLSKAMAPFGVRIDRLYNGSLVVTLSGKTAAGDQASNVARAALGLRALLPDGTFALCTARADAEDRLPVGRVLERAGRVLMAANAGMILTDPASAELLEARFQIADAGQLKSLLFEKGLREPPRTVLGKHLPCVGRDRELRNLEGLYDECVAQSIPRVAVITSPAGGGKSRVRYELCERITNRGHAFELLVGGSDSMRAGRPFGLLGSALLTSANLSGLESIEVKRQRITEHFAAGLAPGESRNVVAFLGEIAGVHFPDDDLPPLRAAREDPRLMVDQTRASFAAWARAACARGPVVIMFEDAHWGDTPSFHTVDHALRLLKDQPLMVVAFGRPELDEAFPGLWDSRDPERVMLPPLTSKACQRLARTILPELSDERAAFLVERADGNPFFLEELLRAEATGTALPTEGGPATVISIVQARFDALGFDAKRVLRAASIFGQRFRTTGVASLLGNHAADLPSWLRILGEKEIVHERDPGAKREGSTREYVFRHGLLRDAAYESLTDRDKKLGHRLAGEWLEAQGDAEAIALVMHFERAEENAKAAYWCGPAAEAAIEGGDPTEAIARAERGVGLGAEGEVLGRILAAKAKGHLMAGDNIASEGVARRAMVLLAGKSRLEFAPIALIALGNLQRFDEVRTLMVGLASEQREHTSDQDWRRCLIHAAQCETFAGNYQEARRLLDQAASNGVATLRGGNLGLYLSARAVLDNILDCPFPALEQFSRALAIFESRGDVKNAAFVMADLAFIEGECGLLENAHVTTGRAMEKFREAGLQGSVALLYANAAQAHFYGDRLPEAKRDASEAVRLTKGQDHRVEGLALGTLARVAAREGEGPLAVQLAIQAVERHRLLPTYLSGSLAVLARANLANHAHSESHRAATEAWQLLRATGASESLEALVRCVYVESRLASGDSAAAVAALAEACNWLRGRLVGIRSPADRSAFRAFEDHKRLCELAQIYGLADPIIEKGNAPL